MKKLILLFTLLISFSACGPTIHYLGDTYTSKENLDVFYDINDVTNNYVVIGQMTHDKFIDYDLDIIKKEMVSKAKMNGADAIVFQDFSVERENEVDGDRFSVIAKAIRYTEQ